MARCLRVVLCCLLGGLTGCASSGGGEARSSAVASHRSSGVLGTTMVDRGCPVLEGSSSCPEVPLRARVVAVRTGSGAPVGAVESGADGRFRLELEPGRYELSGQNLTGAPVPTAMPVQVTVDPGAFVRVVVHFDSGIRGAPTG
jgi:hypothetical protein